VRRPFFRIRLSSTKKGFARKSKGNKRVSINCFEPEAVFCCEGTQMRKTILIPTSCDNRSDTFTESSYLA